MTNFAQRSLAGGELAPSLYARTDQVKYQTGVRTLRNYFVKRSGGADNRPGTEYIGEVADSAKTVRLIPFIFNDEQTYVLEFGEGYIRFIKDGAYVTDGGNTYELETPYTASNLPELRFVQNADVITIVHKDYSPKELSRFADNIWTFADISLDPSISPPTNVANGGAGGTATYWVVTAVSEDTFEESLQSASTGSSATPTSGAPITVSWTAATGAYQYNVYKLTNGIYGFIGSAGGTSFIDNGITADAEESPPTEQTIVDKLVFALSKVADPSSLPAAAVTDAKFSPNDQFLAVASGSSPYLEIYSVSGTTFTKLSNPGTIPSGACTGVSWSSDSSYLFVSSQASPYILTYERSGSTFTKVANPSSLPPGPANCVAASSYFLGTSLFLAVGVTDPAGTPKHLKLYIFSSGTYTDNTANLDADPSSSVLGVAWKDGLSNNAAGLALALSGGAFLKIYTRLGSGNSFLSATNPSSLPAGQANGIAFSVANNLLAVAHNSSPYVSIYEFDSYAQGQDPLQNFTKLANPANLPAGNGAATMWALNGNYLAVAHTTTPFITVYSRNGATYTKISDPNNLPAGNGRGVGWNSDGTFLSVGHTTTPFATLYEIESAFPGAVSYYQQRLAFGNITNDPEKVFASRSGAFKNFTTHFPTTDDDAVIFRLSGNTVNRIMHMIELQQLILFTSGSEIVIQGDSAGILKPSAINPSTQSYHGSGILAPLPISNGLLYAQGRQSIIRDFAYSDTSKGFAGTDLTIFSSHLFDGHTIVDWAYQENPHSIIWAVRDDGVLLSLTYIKEHEIWAWARHDFENGLVENVCVVSEGTEDKVYLVINREIDGDTVRYIERMANRYPTDVRDYIMMDSAISYDGRHTGDTTMTLSGGTNWTYDESLTLTASASYFVAGDVGNIIQLTGADGTEIRCVIKTYSTGLAVTVKPHKTVPAGMRSVAITEWAKAVDELSGLDHLEGESVSVFADGFVVANPLNDAYDVITVASGAIALDRPYAVIHVGLPVTADIETLDIDTPGGQSMADRKKLISRVNLQVEATRGVWVGPKPPTDDDDDPLEDLDELKIRDNETYDEPVNLTTENVEINIRGRWNSNGRIFIRQIDPLPVSILAIIPGGYI